jgi:glutathione peroxidase
MLRGLQSGTNLGNKLPFPEGFGLYLLGFHEAFCLKNRFRHPAGENKRIYTEPTFHLMKLFITLALAAITMAFTSSGTKSLHDFTVATLEGSEFNFSSLKGKKVLIVNTASECGYTPQYKDLEALYQKYNTKNFTVIGFPCNDFGGQEPGSSAEIKTFCTKNYGVTFPMMGKISIATSPVYQWLTSKAQNGVLDATVKWNFNKFLIDENGKVVKHLASSVKPMDAEITNWIEGK